LLWRSRIEEVEGRPKSMFIAQKCLFDRNGLLRPSCCGSRDILLNINPSITLECIELVGDRRALELTLQITHGELALMIADCSKKFCSPWGAGTQSVQIGIAWVPLQRNAYNTRCAKPTWHCCL
jgi:hypothetical protein